jgi:hypothetical protein
LSIWETLRVERAEYTFSAPAQPFRLALEAERLRLAYAADPLLAANNARVHLLPHLAKDAENDKLCLANNLARRTPKGRCALAAAFLMS